ncbi:MAG: laminin G domain-containing protein [Candidatus Micrarchaeota archaeon]|nr:laminin G domain-containing protein [Candidatus Micrarchaeota archaeon]MDE1848343.1 laminin G domain-containing protein [Candidatus Micrarchaeota archaeon]MDE1863914.1 laminin G domain-containing protein [Candidatus Micrarchaeota archaeon]
MSSKKGQIAIEFLIVFSFVLIVFVFLFAIITQQRAVQQNYQTFSQLQLVAQSLSLQLSRAAASPPGFSEQIPITTTQGLTPYNISITKTGIVILTASSGPQVLHTTSYSNVQGIVSNPAFLANGLYTLPISNGTIFLQNSYGVICVDYLCPQAANQSASIALSSQVIYTANFNGQNYITLPANAAVLGSADRSVSFWIKTALTWGAAGSEPFSWGQESAGSWYGVSYPGSTPKLDVADWAIKDHLSATTLQTNTWYHIVLTLGSSGTVIGLFINGVEDANFPIVSPAFNTLPGNVFISNRADLCTCANLPQGSEMANFQIYSNTLSSSQITQLYGEGINGAPLPINSLIAWLPLNGNTNDYSGNGNNGVTSGPIIYPTVSQLFATVKNSLGKSTSNTLVGFTTDFGNFSNGMAQTSLSQGESSFTNSNGIATIFLNQQQLNGIAHVKATAFNGNLSTQSELVGWYPLNKGTGNTSFDLSPSGNNGQMYGQPSWGIPNYVGNFDGRTGYIQDPNGISASSFTISAYVRFSNYSNQMIEMGSPVNQNHLLMLEKGNGNCGNTVSNTGYMLKGRVGNVGSGFYTVCDPITSSLNTWYHVVTSYDGSTLRIYVNGVQMAQYSVSITPSPSAAEYIGACTLCNYYSSGGVSNVQIYNTALSQAQITRLYQGGIGSSPVPGTGISAWWPLNGNANDYSFNNQNGSIYGGVSFIPLLPTLSAQQVSNGNSAKILTASFNGLSDIYVGNILKINSISNWTVSFWMNSTAVVGYKNPLDMNFVPSANNAGPRFEQGGAAGANSFNLIVGTGPSTYSVYTYSNTIIPDVWYHVVAARSGNSIIGYLNGVQTFNQQNTNWPSGFGNMTIGRGYANSANRWYSGNLSNVQLYNQTLSPSQVSQLYYGGIGSTPIPNTQLTGWWLLNGNTNDQSIYGINSILVSNIVYNNVVNYVPTLLQSINYSGINFNGQNSYLTVGTNNLPTGSSARSVFAWVNFNNPGPNPFIDYYGTESPYEASALSLSNNALTFVGWGDDYVSTMKVPIDSLHLIGYTYKTGSTQVTLWLDGKSQTGSLSGGTALNTVLSSHHDIGARYDCLSNGCTELNGTLAGMQIYNYNLSSTQVLQLYNRGIPPSAAASIPLSWSP